jgi:cardiolipin synthase
MVRSSDAGQIVGNSARLLVDGTQAFPAWLAAIHAAEQWIHLENYILRDDRTGCLFRDALAEKARAGVRVRVLYDWVGCWATPRSFWRPLRDAGAEVRAFAPPRVADPLRFMRRDHRKVVAVDGDYASVAGMCIGDEWAGSPHEGITAWRDTGVEFRGPAAAAIDRAFARTWRAAGPPLPPGEVPDPEQVAPRGDVAVRVVEGEPGKSRIYRLMQFVAVGVERRLWMTDPYFVLPPAMVEALASTARDGVDVRVLVPAYNNWPIVGGMSRAGYRPLLEAGVRLFEWEGPMIHAKTAGGGREWARVGSTNMNLASPAGNWELDVASDRPRHRHRHGGPSSLATWMFRVESRYCAGRRPPGRASERRATERLVVAGVGDEGAGRWSPPRARRGSFLSGGRRWGAFWGASRARELYWGRALVGERLIGREGRGWITGLGRAPAGGGGGRDGAPRVLAWPLAAVLFWLAWPRWCAWRPTAGPPAERRYEQRVD